MVCTLVQQDQAVDNNLYSCANLSINHRFVSYFAYSNIQQDAKNPSRDLFLCYPFIGCFYTTQDFLKIGIQNVWISKGATLLQDILVLKVMRKNQIHLDLHPGL